MGVPFILGKNSNGEDQLIDLCEVPLLMISFSNENYLMDVLRQICLSKEILDTDRYLLTSSRRLNLLGSDAISDHIHLKDVPLVSNIHSKSQLLKKVIDEIIRREKVLKSKRQKNFATNFSLNLWNTEKLAYQFLVIDNIWDIVVSRPKSLGISLIRIILYGPLVGIHTIFASEISYRNLLQQLITINPGIKKILQTKYGLPEPEHIAQLGQELIFTPDGLVYYKKSSRGDMERYFK